MAIIVIVKISDSFLWDGYIGILTETVPPSYIEDDIDDVTKASEFIKLTNQTIYCLSYSLEEDNAIQYSYTAAKYAFIPYSTYASLFIPK